MERHAGLQRAQARRLNGGAVRHRVGEGHADFDDIGAGARKRFQQFQRSGEIGIAAHEKGHEGGATLGAEFGEAFVDTGCHGGAWASTERPAWESAERA